ncbi:hypothetical protein RJ55_02419 [Drechmeria coniospora]|nr:hypothetical protein RJ55_02419 [Drechmeria coniospora]
MGADDWTAIVALIFTLLTSGFLVASCRYGMGRHWVTIKPADKFETMKYFYMAQVTYKASINFTKCCILLLYLRLFRIVRWFKWSCWALLGCIGIYCAASVLVTIFQCRPLARAFDKTVAGTCIDMSKFWFANAGFSIGTDIIILLLPMPLVYRLNVPLAQKVALAALFAVGTFVVATSCLRVTTLDVFATSPDHTYNIANVMWTIIEPNVAVLCACLPILRPLIVKLFPSLGSKGYSGDGSGLGHGSKSRRRLTTAGPSRNDKQWLELGSVKAETAKRHEEGIQRLSSSAGSDENILAGKQTGRSLDGIHKTAEHNIKFAQQSSN